VRPRGWSERTMRLVRTQPRREDHFMFQWKVKLVAMSALLVAIAATGGYGDFDWLRWGW
jgi:hypothetical protein